MPRPTRASSTVSWLRSGRRIDGRLVDLRARADYGSDDFSETDAELRALAAEAAAFVARCRGIVIASTAGRPDEPHPPPDD